MDDSMNMDMMISLMLGILYAYVALTAFSHFFRLRREGILFQGKLLCPANCEMHTCIDEPGYVLYIKPKMLLMGIGCTLFLAFEIASVFLADGLPDWLEISCQIALPVILVIYMVVIFRMGAKRYW